MINFRDMHGHDLFINPRFIEAILPNRGQAEIVMTSGKSYTVDIAAEEVAKKIADWEAIEAIHG